MEPVRYYFLAPPVMAAERREATRLIKKRFENVEVKIVADGTRIAFDSSLLEATVESDVNGILFGLKIPGAERIDPPE